MEKSITEITGTLVMALTCIDGKRYDEAKQYIVGALQLFDEQNKTQDLVGPAEGRNRRLRKNQGKRSKKS